MYPYLTLSYRSAKKYNNFIIRPEFDAADMR